MCWNVFYSNFESRTSVEGTRMDTLVVNVDEDEYKQNKLFLEEINSDLVFVDKQ